MRIACPSARRPDQNRHRLADGWQGSTVRAILDNPRYTGYAVFGRWATAKKARRSRRRRGRARDPFPPGRPGTRRAVPRAGAPGDRVGGDVHADPAAARLPGRRGPGGAAQARTRARPGQAHLRAARAGPVRVLLAEDGGHAQARPRLLPLRDAQAGAGLAGPGHASAQRLPPGAVGAARAERLDRGAVQPRQHRSDRGRAARVPGRQPRSRGRRRRPRSTGTRSSDGWPTPRRACRASVPRSRPEPTPPRWSSRSTPPRSSAPPRRPNSACPSPTRPG